MPGGRPTKYNDEILIQSFLYCRDFHKRNADLNKFREAAPSIVGLARFINISRETIYQWAKDEDKPEFSDIVRTLEEDRELILLNKALYKELSDKAAGIALSIIGIREIKESKIEINEYDDLSEEELIRLSKEK